MKILLFCPYYPPHTGGLESHAAELNHQLAAHPEIESITLFVPHFPLSTPQIEQTEPKITVVRFPAIEVIPYFPLAAFWQRAYWMSYSHITQQRYDLVLSRTRFFTTSLMALLYSKRYRTPWIHIEHGSDYIQLSSPITNAIGRIYDHTFGWLIFQASTVNLAISRAVGDFIAHFTKRPSPVIYRGVAQESIINSPIDDTLKKQYPSTFRIGFVGRLIDGKGVLDLLSALDQLENRKSLLFIVGDGPQRMILETRVAELKLNDRVIFFGNQPTSKAMSILKICDVFVNPSYTEGLPTSVIEAALCQKAIVATDVGGTREIITDGESGYLFPAHDVTALVKRLNQLAADRPLREKLGKAAYETAKERFDWNKRTAEYLKLFKQVTTP